MTSTTSRLRTRLDTLWKAIRDENIVSDQVSDDFLRICKIKLVQHVFITTDHVSNYEPLYLNQSPPVLFAPLPKVAFTEHPFMTRDVRIQRLTVLCVISSIMGPQTTLQLIYKTLAIIHDISQGTFRSGLSLASRANASLLWFTVLRT